MRGLFIRAVLRRNSRECRSGGGARSLLDMAGVGAFGRRVGTAPGAINFLEALPEVTFCSRSVFMRGFIYSSCRKGHLHVVWCETVRLAQSHVATWPASKLKMLCVFIWSTSYASLGVVFCVVLFFEVELKNKKSRTKPGSKSKKSLLDYAVRSLDEDKNMY